jgi:hypothetical protein
MARADEAAARRPADQVGQRRNDHRHEGEQLIPEHSGVETIGLRRPSGSNA